MCFLESICQRLRLNETNSRNDSRRFLKSVYYLPVGRFTVPLSTTFAVSNSIWLERISRFVNWWRGREPVCSSSVLNIFGRIGGLPEVGRKIHGLRDPRKKREVMMCRRQRPQGIWSVLGGKILEVDYRCQQQPGEFGRKFAPSPENVLQSCNFMFYSFNAFSIKVSLIVHVDED